MLQDRYRVNPRVNISHSVLRDDSLSFFKEARKYRGRLLLSCANREETAGLEAALLCFLVFLEIVRTNQTNGDTLRFGWKNDERKLVPFFLDWFKDLKLPAFEVDFGQLHQVIQLVNRYDWKLTKRFDEHSFHVGRPWILGYLYERWINKRKVGAYFTPDPYAYRVARFALEEWLGAQYEAEFGNSRPAQDVLDAPLKAGAKGGSEIYDWILDRIAQVRVADLSMGSGAFLLGAARVLFELYVMSTVSLDSKALQVESQLQTIYNQNLFGFDIGVGSVIVGKLRLALLPFELGVADTPPFELSNLICADALMLAPLGANAGQLRLLGEQELAPEQIAARQALLDFDISIGNPPFIALSQRNSVTGKNALVKAWNLQYPQYALTPTVDLSNFFVLHGLELLRPNGVLVYITSRNFFDTRYGAPIRRFLTEQVDLQHVLTLHDHPFTQEGLKAKANTAILAVVKRPPRPTVHFNHLISADHNLSRVQGKQVPKHLLQSSENWTNTLFGNPLRAKLAGACQHTLGEFARVRMGLKSGCNDFFLLRAESKIIGALRNGSSVLAPVIKNSRAIKNYILPGDSPYQFFNVSTKIGGIEDGYEREGDLDPVAHYIYQKGIKYSCSRCQSLAESEHRAHPELFPHRGMCQHCNWCLEHQTCDRPVDRLSTQGRLPAWYALALSSPPRIAVQCIVDTEIGVFLNLHKVYVTDQFQVIDQPSDEQTGSFLFLYLNSRIAHFLLEGLGLHRARFDGSFMLKIQVEHLRKLPIPELRNLSSDQKSRLLELFEASKALSDRKSEEAKQFRDGLDLVFLEMMSFDLEEIPLLQAELRKALEEAILFRWLKTRNRLPQGTDARKGS